MTQIRRLNFTVTNTPGIMEEDSHRADERKEEIINHRKRHDTKRVKRRSTVHSSLSCISMTWDKRLGPGSLYKYIRM